MNSKLIGNRLVKHGDYTKTVYSWIKDGKRGLRPVTRALAKHLPINFFPTGQYKDAIAFLSEKQILNPTSRAALSLLGYCYYFSQDFANAASCYEQLVQLFPEVHEYKMHYAQSLYQSCAYEEAMRATFQMEDSRDQAKSDILKLQAAIKVIRAHANSRNANFIIGSLCAPLHTSLNCFAVRGGRPACVSRAN